MAWYNDLWNDLTSAGSDFFDWLEEQWENGEEAIEDGADAVAGAWVEFARDLSEAFEDAWADLSDTWGDLWDEIGDAFKNGFFQGLLTFFGAIFSGIIATIGIAIDAIFDVIGAIGGFLISLIFTLIGTLLRLLIIIFSLGGGLAVEFARDVARWFTDVGVFLGQIWDEVFDGVGNILQRGFELLAGVVIAVFRWLRCIFSGASRVSSRISPVRYFFVLMLENRSFHHMLGLLNGASPGSHTNPQLGGGDPIGVQGQAQLALNVDPPHIFEPIQDQILTDPPMQGFVKSFQREFPSSDATQVMRCFERERLPVLHQLAEEFAVCDAWFSSVPGPTIPNRLFAMAGTSGGLASQPKDEFVADALTTGGFEFEYGSVFDRLDRICLGWRVYSGDTPLAALLKGLVAQDVAENGRRLGSLQDLVDGLAEGTDFPALTWIEPQYNYLADYAGGNSQHPPDSVVAGEALIKSVYEAIRGNRLVWEQSALIILYDEHGGFFDPVTPPAAEPPGDAEDYTSWAAEEAAKRFKFDRLGVRVPAVVVSPYIERGTVCHLVRDHTSIIKTLDEKFAKPDVPIAMTARAKAGKSLWNLFTRSTPRGDTPATLNSPYTG